MKKLFLLFQIAIVVIQISCNTDLHKNAPENKEKPLTPKTSASTPTTVFSIDPKLLTKDFDTWYNYTYYNVHLSQDFIGLDPDSIKTDKLFFLNKLMTGKVVALKTGMQEGKTVYQLFNLTNKDESIKATAIQMAATEIAHYKMEGKQLPEFHFTDMAGKVYNKATTKGKILVVKCWFIHCIACVKEFPELNSLVDENKGRNDVLFISLATDAKPDLVKFLQTKEFGYAVVPEAGLYMNNQLHIDEYPTHLLIGRDGKIKKVVNRIEDLKPFLKKETAVKAL